MQKLKNISELRNLRDLLVKNIYRPGQNMIKVCCGLPCSTLGSHEVARSLEEETTKSGLDIHIVRTGCQGLCQRGPLLQIEPHGFLYQKVHADRAKEIVSTTYTTHKPVTDLLYRESFLDRPKEFLKDIPFYKKQMKIALRNTGNIDPFNIRHYVAAGGYRAVEKIFSSMSPEQVIEEMRKSNHTVLSAI